MNGKVISLNISKNKGEIKTPLESAMFIEKFGMEGDAHGGDWHRQISLLDMESIDKIKNKGVEIFNGSFAENITTEGIKLYELPIGTILEIGETIQEVTQIGKECHNSGCAVKTLVGDCVMPREGIFTIIIKGGIIRVGDEIIIK